VDYVITHCTFTSVAQVIDPDYQPDTLTDFLKMVNQRLDFCYWILDHYNNHYSLTGKYILLWEQIV